MFVTFFSLHAKLFSLCSILYKFSADVVEVELVSRSIHLTVTFIKFSFNVCIRYRLYWTNVNQKYIHLTVVKAIHVTGCLGQ
jgi:hypothetical protein